MCISGHRQNCEISKVSLPCPCLLCSIWLCPFKGLFFTPLSPPELMAIMSGAEKKHTAHAHLGKKSPSLASRRRPSPPPLPEYLQGSEACSVFPSSSFLGYSKIFSGCFGNQVRCTIFTEEKRTDAHTHILICAVFWGICSTS